MSDSAPQTLSVEEAGHQLGLGRSASYRAANAGQFPVLRIGRRLFVLKRPFDLMLEGKLIIEPRVQRQRVIRPQTVEANPC